MTPDEIRRWADEVRNEEDCGESAALLDGIAARIAELEAEVARLAEALDDLRVNAAMVMQYLAEDGARVVGHLLDSDDNPGQRTRDAVERAEALIDARLDALAAPDTGGAADGDR